jgi:aflatoxin B1 aldehyde reductase
MVKIIVGMMGSSVASGSSALSSPSQITDFLAVVRKHGIKDLDTARVYNGGRSEELLGSINAARDFNIATKAPAFSPGSLQPQKIIENCDKSLAALKTEKVDIYYLHGPDRATPLSEQLAAIGKLYEQGKFEKFGVSNLRREEVESVVEICKREGYPMPYVYQGGFNPLNRTAASALFPTLRKHGIAFYAFSPLAGGALAKPVDSILNPGEDDRFAKMSVFRDIYATEKNVAALRTLAELCEKNGISVMEAALRWFVHHSPLGEDDGFILGASRTSQIEASLRATEGPPLSQGLVAAFEEMWEGIAGGENAPAYCA